MQYPLPLEQWGPSWWKNFHSKTAVAPDYPSRMYKHQFKQWLDRELEWFPFDSCKANAKRWVKEHPPRLKTRKDLFMWGCDLHNYVNEKTGKSVWDCSTMLGPRVVNGGCIVENKKSNKENENNDSSQSEVPPVSSRESRSSIGGLPSSTFPLSSIPTLAPTHGVDGTSSDLSSIGLPPAIISIDKTNYKSKCTKNKCDGSEFKDIHDHSSIPIYNNINDNRNNGIDDDSSNKRDQSIHDLSSILQPNNNSEYNHSNNPNDKFPLNHDLSSFKSEETNVKPDRKTNQQTNSYSSNNFHNLSSPNRQYENNDQWNHASSNAKEIDVITHSTSPPYIQTNQTSNQTAEKQEPKITHLSSSNHPSSKNNHYADSNTDTKIHQMNKTVHDLSSPPNPTEKKAPDKKNIESSSHNPHFNIRHDHSSIPVYNNINDNRNNGTDYDGSNKRSQSIHDLYISNPNQDSNDSHTKPQTNQPTDKVRMKIHDLSSPPPKNISTNNSTYPSNNKTYHTRKDIHDLSSPDQMSKKQSRNNTNDPSNKLRKPINQDNLSTTFGQYKQSVLGFFSEICSKEGVPPPHVKFTDCPSHPDQSCTHFFVRPDGSLTPSKPPVVYLSPHQFSPRTIAHEAYHVIRKYKGTDTLNEFEINTQARELIDKYFGEKKNIEQSPSIVVMDTDSRSPERWRNTFPSYAKYLDKSKHVKAGDPPHLGFGVTASPPFITPSIQFPGSTVNELEEKKQNPPEEGGGTQLSDGILAMGDPIFTPVARVLGVSPRDVNEAHTPAILSNIVMTGAEANLNHFGSLAVSMVSALATLAIGTLARANLGLGDRKLLVELGGNFTWNSLRYIGQKRVRNEVINNAKKFGHGVASMNTPTIISSFISREEPLPPMRPPAKHISDAAKATARRDVTGIFEGATGPGTPRGGRPYYEEEPEEMDMDLDLDKDGNDYFNMSNG
jgi:hypothetical protein